MRVIWKLGVVLTVIVSGPAAAETWRARADLIATKSAEGCARDGSVYTLELAGDAFSGNRLEMSGNVKTRHLEIYSGLRGCWWHLVPVK
jgi:hypothetical protein